MNPPAGSKTRHLGEVVIPIATMEKQAILMALRQTNGNKILAAKLLGIGKTTLYRKFKEYGVQFPPDSRESCAPPSDSPPDINSSEANSGSSVQREGLGISVSVAS